MTCAGKPNWLRKTESYTRTFRFSPFPEVFSVHNAGFVHLSMLLKRQSVNDGLVQRSKFLARYQHVMHIMSNYMLDSRTQLSLPTRDFFPFNVWTTVSIGLYCIRKIKLLKQKEQYIDCVSTEKENELKMSISNSFQRHTRTG